MGGRWHDVKRGESAESIATEQGHFVNTVWDHPENARLKEQRANPNVLMAGDRLFVPDVQPAEHSIETGKSHRFRRKGIPSRIYLILQAAGKPLADEPYVLEVDGELFRGRSGADGAVIHAILPNAKAARLRVGEGFAARILPIALRALDPADTLSGVQGRLHNLGYCVDDADGERGPTTAAAIKRFRRDHRLPAGEELDDALIAELKKTYGQ